MLRLFGRSKTNHYLCRHKIKRCDISLIYNRYRDDTEKSLFLCIFFGQSKQFANTHRRATYNTLRVHARGIPHNPYRKRTFTELPLPHDSCPMMSKNKLPFAVGTHGSCVRSMRLTKQVNRLLERTHEPCVPTYKQRKSR